MPRKIIDRFLSFARYMFFEEISPKFRKESLKKFMDFSYVVFEKFVNKFDVISYNYLKLYAELVEKEINMANISPEDSILVIGCGSLPSTSALIAMKTDADIVSIDNDQKAINDANSFLKNLDIDDKIKLECADGLYFPVDDFDVIFILYGVKQQENILKYLFDNIKDDTRLILRTATDVEGKIQGGMIDFSNLFVIRDHVESRFLGQVNSLLLSKILK